MAYNWDMDELDERWLPYPGFAGFYEVSDRGNVRSLARATTRGKLLRPVYSKKGRYRTYNLSKYGRVTRRRGSRMVLETFTGSCPPGHEACHGPAGNQGERCGSSKLTDAIVLECRRRYAAGETQTALAAESGVSSGAMNRAIRGYTWAHLTEDIPDPEVDGRSLISTPEMRERRREFGRKGAGIRWG